MAMTVTSLDNLRYKSNITSIRLINKVVEKFCAALTQHLRETVEDCMLCDQWGEYCEYSFPSLFITPVVGEWQEGEGQLLSFVTPHLDKFQAVKKKKKTVSHQRQNPECTVSGKDGGVEFFGSDVSGSWQSLYKLPPDSRPLVEDCAWGNSYKQTQSAP